MNLVQKWTGINSGLTPRKGPDAPKGLEPVNAYVCAIESQKIDATLAKIEKAGGTVATDKMDVPTVGLLL